MDKRSEIREGVINRLQNLWTVQTYEDKLSLAKYLLEYLHSQGLKLPNEEALIE